MHQVNLLNLDELNRVLRSIQGDAKKESQVVIQKDPIAVQPATVSVFTSLQSDIWIVDTDDLGSVNVDVNGLALMKQIRINVPA